MSNNNILHSISYFEFFKYRMRIVLQEWRRGTFPMVVWGEGGGGGVAIAEINQPWLANIGILSHLGYFHKVVDDYLIVLSIN